MKKVFALFAFILIAMASLTTVACSGDGAMAGITADFTVDKYFVGETIDLTEAEIIVSYEGRKADKRVAITEDMVEDFDTSSAGTKTILVKYREGDNEKHTTFDIEVYEVVQMALRQRPLKQEYKTTDAQIDLEGIKIELSAVNNDCVKELRVTQDMVSGYNPSLVTPDNPSMTQNITVAFGGKSCNFNVVVSLNGIALFDKALADLEGIDLENISDEQANQALDALKTYKILREEAMAYYTANQKHDTELGYWKIQNLDDSITKLTTIAFTYNYETFKTYSTKLDSLFTLRAISSVDTRENYFIDGARTYEALKELPSDYNKVMSTFLNSSIEIFQYEAIGNVYYGQGANQNAISLIVQNTVKPWFTAKSTRYGQYARPISYAIELYEMVDGKIPTNWTDDNLASYANSTIIPTYNRMATLYTTDNTTLCDVIANTSLNTMSFVNGWYPNFMEIFYTYYHSKVAVPDDAKLTILTGMYPPEPLQLIHTEYSLAYTNFQRTLPTDFYGSPAGYTSDFTYAFAHAFNAMHMVDNFLGNGKASHIYIFFNITIPSINATYDYYTATLDEEVVYKTLGRYTYDEVFYEFLNDYSLLIYNVWQIASDEYVTLDGSGVITYTDKFFTDTKDMFNRFLGLEPDQAIAFLRLIDANWVYSSFGYTVLTELFRTSSVFMTTVSIAYTKDYNTTEELSIFSDFITAYDVYIASRTGKMTQATYEASMDTILNGVKGGDGTTVIQEGTPDFFTNSSYWIHTEFASILDDMEFLYNGVTNSTVEFEKSAEDKLFEDFVLTIDYFVRAHDYVYSTVEYLSNGGSASDITGQQLQTAGNAYSLAISAMAKVLTLAEQLETENPTRYEEEIPLCLFLGTDDETGDTKALTYKELYEYFADGILYYYTYSNVDLLTEDSLEFLASLFVPLSSYFFDQWVGTLVQHWYFDVDEQTLENMLDLFMNLDIEDKYAITSLGFYELQYMLFDSMASAYIESFIYGEGGVGFYVENTLANTVETDNVINSLVFCMEYYTYKEYYTPQTSQHYDTYLQYFDIVLGYLDDSYNALSIDEKAEFDKNANLTHWINYFLDMIETETDSSAE